MENIQIVAEAGANVVVSGTGVFGHSDPKHAISLMRESLEKIL